MKTVSAVNQGKPGRRRISVLLSLLVAFLLATSAATRGRAQGITGNIRGTVVDNSGARIPGAAVKIANASTGLTRTLLTAANGSFVATLLPPGTYTVVVSKSGFQTFTQTAVRLKVSSTFVINVTLQVGSISQTVTVTAAPIQIDKTTMELGGELAGTQVTNFPLLNLNWLQLQQTLPGVMASSDRFGTFSTNGNRTQSNDFTINGMDANDLPLNTPLGGGVNPLNPDAIREVKVVDSTVNPEYGRNSGATENVVTKSGTNAFHGSAYDYYRTTGLDARTFFQPATTPYHQNQFGATLGGPVLHNKVFFFFGYQGVRLLKGASDSTSVFTNAERGINGLANWSSSLRKLKKTDVSPFPLFGDANSPCPYTGTSKCGAGTPYHTLFSTGMIPTADFNSISAALLNKYVPLPNIPGGTIFAFSNNSTYTSDQYLGRLDFHFTPRDSAFFFFFMQPLSSTSTIPFTGATLPGFGDKSHQNIYRYTLDETHIINSRMVNEFRIGWQRFNTDAVEPQTPVLPASAGFSGITPQYPNIAGLPVISITGFFNLGFSTNGPQPRIDSTGELSDNFSFATGTHNFQFGADIRRSTVVNPIRPVSNSGHFAFSNTGAFSTGLPGVDFLLGIPDSYGQGSGGVINARTWMIYSYAQDQWQVKSDLTLTYGVGWQIDTPLTQLYNKGVSVNAFRPGVQSTVFPSAPTGLLFPGDPGINSAGGMTTHFHNFGPRFGFAYNPVSKFVVRGGWGIYFDNSEEETTLQNLAAPPFTLTSSGVGDVGLSPSFAQPFTSVNSTPVCLSACGTSHAVIEGAGSIQNKFPFTPPSPGSPVDFSFFEPMRINVVSPTFNLPYVMNMNLTTQYQFTPTTVATISYVGSLGRRLEGAIELNPYNAQVCLSTPGCPAGRAHEYTFPGVGTTANASIIGSIGQEATFLTSNYNSLQVSVQKAMSHGLYIRGAYTYGHALDYGSSFEDTWGSRAGLNPFNIAANYGNSNYDARQRFVVEYQYNIPDWSFGILPRRLTEGWGFSGITTFQTGFPVTLHETATNTLECAPSVSKYGCWNRPQVTGAPLNTGTNPRTSTNHQWFNPAAFAPESLGTFGNAGRNSFYGPGINNWDVSFWKNTVLHEHASLQLRVDMFNVWNHAQFANPVSNVDSGLFGQITNTTGNARTVQLSAHVYF